MSGPFGDAGGGDGWDEIEERLAPLDALVPREVPPWRAAAMGALSLGGVVVASMVALFTVVSIERSIFPDADASDVTHGIALGVSMAVWGLLSLGLLAGAARLTLGHGASLGRRDLAFAAVVLVLLAGWTVGLHAWVVGIAGYVELDLVQRGTYIWPAVVMLITLALAAVRITRGRLAIALTGLAAIAIAVLVLETARNAIGATADGDVSAAGLAVGVLSIAQISVLGTWCWSTVRERFRG